MVFTSNDDAKIFLKEKLGAVMGKEDYLLRTAQLFKKHLGVNVVGLRFIDNIYIYDDKKISYDDVIGMINKKLKFTEDAGFVVVP